MSTSDDSDPSPQAGIPISQESGKVSGREAYNIVSDTITGPNLRLKDNLLQAAIVGVFIVIGVVVGAIAVEERLIGAAVGAFIGLVAGLLVSGIFLMIYRAVRHLKGRHD